MPHTIKHLVTLNLEVSQFNCLLGCPQLPPLITRGPIDAWGISHNQRRVHRIGYQVCQNTLSSYHHSLAPLAALQFGASFLSNTEYPIRDYLNAGAEFRALLNTVDLTLGSSSRSSRYSTPHGEAYRVWDNQPQRVLRLRMFDSLTLRSSMGHVESIWRDLLLYDVRTLTLDGVPFDAPSYFSIYGFRRSYDVRATSCRT
ncbi:hypothetical protein BXZ70DRAFT_949460 [Cristinia sonorae]|uniref:Uncharacterized protein n=1 Tax=Cristinia sonorae TaxID=1940300 RepID=A0A8K0XME7_9AGAR|nr:hypothetical protein BXZ70DRAFT_949460 [Cristinia sonorae]